MRNKSQHGTPVVNRCSVILATSKKNQEEIIGRLEAIGGLNQSRSNESYDTGSKIIHTYGYTACDPKNKEHRFSFCRTSGVARNEVPCGELKDIDIEIFFSAKTQKQCERLLSRKNVDVYAPIPNNYKFR